ncbi:hypothetical protein [Ottowia sp.]|uniref:hypothetical protein n=1 Tax=Ottowia sp. TaxID=1898956 RepID=UPI003A8BFFC2
MSSADDIASFESAVVHWSVGHVDWVGGVQVWPSDRDIAGGGLYPDSGDAVVYDARGRSGLMGVHHDNLSDIHPVKLKSAKKFGITLRQKNIPRRVPTEELIRRYNWISTLFIDWLHVDGASPFDHWPTPQAITAAFEDECQDFAHDPHLALYWLMHFGLCLDPRYAEVADAVRGHGHDQMVERVRLALAFFDHTEVSHDIDLIPRYNPLNKDYSRLFLRRRANLLYLNWSQSYRGDGQPLDLLWQSVVLYRAGDAWAIRRACWLRNNL